MDNMHHSWQDTTNFFSPEYLHVNSCGRQICAKNACNGKGFTLLRESGRVDYHILYIIEGHCVLTYAGQKRTLHAGDGILYKPFERQEYHFPPEVDTATFWLHFSGSAIEKILKEAGFWQNTFFHLQHPQKTEELFLALIREQRLRQFQYEMMSNSLLLSVLTNITRDARANDEQNTFEGILPALTALHDHPEEDVSLQAYADMCHLSQSRFIHLFTAFTGSSPHHYRLTLRIDRAKELLAYASMTVAEVAATVGFADPLYFSRLFRKYTGMSPLAYRQKKQR